MIPKFKLTIKNGSIGNFYSQDFLAYCKSLPDGEYFVIVKTAKEHEIRSNNQNKYYWKCVVGPISEHLGYTPDETHEILKFKFNPLRAVINGTVIRVGNSTTSLNTIQFEQMLTEIREWCSIELSLFIALP